MRLSDDLALAHALADAAGDAIRPFFRARYDTEFKADASPVTEADRAAESAIRAILEKERPNDGIIGEEYGATREDAERVWILDPIDGTRSFIAGRPIFGSLIALSQAGWPVLGIIDQPIARERWAGAAGLGTTYNGSPVKTRACRQLSDAILASTAPQLFPGCTGEHFSLLARDCRDTLWGGDCYNYALVASGHVDLVVEAGLKLHDIAALVPVVEGAGGRMCDWSGDPLTDASDGRVIALGDPARLDDVLEALNAGHEGHHHH
ncbi:MAG: histidinol-phosphatase [Sphingobium sp.]|jgi:inositol-phosphate phosphatase/L-galactose 1-phosphate phosphatase/histidinol-phosphatase|nr:histidinol-phosphatase [Sphingomonadaceae bacterium]MCH4151617.1 histidinol-phosphatase [Sphingobium sp.]MCI1271038.1 histidinol-phosphatase [Sphingobium sp.]MCI1755672.1 histidinol-phosphatase [Sphingobium sp.]MCI2052570.1 histidinol-phosphatase [Sphingobium sp.]